MREFLFIDHDQIGEVELKVIDESMGVLGGDLIPGRQYDKYRYLIQKQCDEKGISNSSDFNYRIISEDETELNPPGIGVTDVKGFSEVFVECVGLDEEVIQKFKKRRSSL